MKRIVSILLLLSSLVQAETPNKDLFTTSAEQYGSQITKKAIETAQIVCSDNDNNCLVKVFLQVFKELTKEYTKQGTINTEKLKISYPENN